MPMILRTSNEWERAVRRVLHIGPPNSWKTALLATYPKPIGYVCSPREVGHSTMPQVEGITSFIWEPEKDKEMPSSLELTKQMWTAIEELIAGKYGEIQTLAIDGIHKWCRLYVDAEARDKWADVSKDEFGRTVAVGYQNWFKKLQLVCQSHVPHIACTVWDAYEKDDPLDDSKKAPQHIYPALPGQAAKQSIGEFGMCLFHEQDDMKPGTFMLKTKPGGRVWGAGTKVPVEVARRIPAKINPCDSQGNLIGWPVVEKYLQPITSEVPKSVRQTPC